MPSRLTESAIEEFAIKLFERLGYRYVYAPDIAPDGEQPERGHYGEVLLAGRLAQALKRINPKLSPAMLQDALKEVQRISSPELLANNEAFHRLLTEGVKVSHLVELHHARNARVFSSVVRGDDTDGSDLDLIVDPQPGATLFDLGALQVDLEEALGIPVDLLTPGDLPPGFRAKVLAEAEPV